MSQKRTQRVQSGEPAGISVVVKPVLTSVAVGAAICAVVLVLLSVLLSARNIPHSLINPMATFAISVGALAAGFCCAKIVRRAGLAYGALCGGVFCLVIMLAGIGMADNGFGLTALFKITFMMICAMLGGVLGVNSSPRRRK
ncbi:MAG: TIGR04086 family membrane protein [Oscillospiraceae bacterium]|nr:TIGR04086 family membrane protein [Oscillospiraceae bacterium]